MHISDTDLAGPGNFFANVARSGAFKLGESGSRMNISYTDLAGPGNFFGRVGISIPDLARPGTVTFHACWIRVRKKHVSDPF